MKGNQSIGRFYVIKLLKKFCDDSLIEGIMGDLQEIYDLDHKQLGPGKARKNLFWRSIGFFRPSFKRKKTMYSTRFEALLRNYVKMTFRNGRRNKTSTLINILGITFGLTASIFLAQYVYFQYQHDRHFSDHDNIYRLVIDMEFGDNIVSIASTPSGLGHKAVDQIKSVDNYVMLRRYTTFKFKEADRMIESEYIYSANPELHSVLDFHWISGDPALALVNPNSIVLTELLANKICGSTDDVLGKSLTRDNGDVYTVTGIIKTPLPTSHIHPEAFIALRDMDLVHEMDIWRYCTYVKVKKNTGLDNFKQELEAFSLDVFKAKGGNGRGRIYIQPQPLADIHFVSKLDFEMEPNEGNQTYLIGFIILIVVLLFMSIINYINLTTAQVGHRMKEISVKRTFGAFNSDLRWQFLVETTIYVLLSVVLSMGIVVLFQSSFEVFANLHFPWYSFFNVSNVSIGFGLLLLLVVLLGGYPALYLSSRRSIKQSAVGLSRFRTFMLFVQLGLSMVVITCTTVFFYQMDFMSNQDLGYSKDQVIIVNLNREEQDKLQPLKDALRTIPFISETASAQHIPGTTPPINNFEYSNEMGDHKLVCPQAYGDSDYLKTLGIRIIAGEDFTEGGNNQSGVIVNERFVQNAGWSNQNAVGQVLKSGTSWEGKIIGVIPDFHFTSLHNAIEPMVIRQTNDGHQLLVSTLTTDYQSLIEKMERQWKAVLGYEKFDFKFLDQHFQAQYEADFKRTQLFAIFSSLIVFIALSGLFGMIAYAVQYRMKEMSIRKVHGANIGHILFLMTRQYGVISVIAGVTGSSLSFYLMQNWLENYAYAIHLHPALLSIPPLILVVVVLGVAGVKSSRLVFVNPAETLRNE